ncbi:MAG: hypothetical protein U0822_11515 [Anaerolineae bacterium]
MESTAAEQPEQPTDDTFPTPLPRRALKLVLTLQPRDDAHYRALVALGADGCDPILHTLDAGDLPAILAAIPDLLAQAEAHWAVHPRYPTVPTPPKATAKPATPAKPAATQPEQAPDPADGEHPSHPAPRAPTVHAEPSASDSAGQLTLFG